MTFYFVAYDNTGQIFTKAAYNRLLAKMLPHVKDNHSHAKVLPAHAAHRGYVDLIDDEFVAMAPGTLSGAVYRKYHANNPKEK